MISIQQTDKQELGDIPLAKLATLCRNPKTLATALSIAYNQGYKIGQEQAHRFYGMMFAGQSEVTITN